MNEDDLAKRIVSRIDQGLDDIPPSALDRLAIARRAALEHHRRRSASPRWSAALDWVRGWVAAHGVAARVGVPVAFAALATAAFMYFESTMHHESIEVEAALLADELPIHAYTDPGFDAWLRHTSDERQQ
jgi:hypothetical protein